MASGGFGRALRQFTLSKVKSGGRNSSGRITSFHRGGGAKRLQRNVDLKRDTSSMGIVERIEYDPNRSSRIALVRWKGEDNQRKCNMTEEFSPSKKRLESTTTTIRGPFAFSSLPGNVDERKIACRSPGLKAVCGVVSLPTRISSCSKNQFTIGSKKTSAKDVFLSAFSSPRAKGETGSRSFSSSSGFPRIAVAGAKPPFFVFRMKEKVGGENTFCLGEIQKWTTDSNIWTNRIKSKAAVSWHGLEQHKSLRLVGASEHDEVKQKIKKNGMSKVDRAPVSYIIATHQMKVGEIVMNCEWTKPSD